ncbi:hypothetical protein [Methylobacterium dankookense]|uniref:Uncharacterized protein n=1 Tax=Methylobacterium dankookense TaxID=560405 RepID=A0A564G722_9HYPH|nr:hypothetical protein [Methylobacterium dankookense]VUF16137.1 hypothetical protein MTDSW087_05894 [Methylobacterium dankookense]
MALNELHHAKGHDPFAQQEIARAAQSVIEYPPMQKGASFNLESVKQQIEKAMSLHHAN